MTEKDPSLTGVFEVDVTEKEDSGFYPKETKFVQIEYHGDGYYAVTCLDGNKEQIRDGPNDGTRVEERIRGALESEPEGKYSLFV